jgi:L,D-peptidoglycan transpeptidase YkuD (ErfK/YbiS/YcfS/YnhG family)
LKAPSLRGRITLLGAVSLLFFACQSPPTPPEAAEAESLERSIWSAGASLYAPREYDLYRRDLKAIQDVLAAEAAKFGWFRNYGPVRQDLQTLLASGRSLLERIRSRRSAEETALAAEIGEGVRQAALLRSLTGYFNENGNVRKNIAQADIRLAEAEMLVRKSEFEKARRLLDDGRASIEAARDAAAKTLSRYLDPAQLALWKRWADETVAESRARGTTVFLVSKLERKLHIYRKGVRTASYDIGLGRFGLSDKMYSGDEATPEGRYKILRKYPNGSFSKALLIDYPNEEDKRSFARRKRAGAIPGKAAIGGAIEIHGGGKDSLTWGCVGLENPEMDVVYAAAAVGTAVTIVGTLAEENSILDEIRKMKRQ